MTEHYVIVGIKLFYYRRVVAGPVMHIRVYHVDGAPISTHVCLM